MLNTEIFNHVNSRILGVSPKPLENIYTSKFYTFAGPNRYNILPCNAPYFDVLKPLRGTVILQVPIPN